MPNAQRTGDPNTAGGIAQGGFGSVRINGRPVILPGNPVTAHPPCGRRNQARHCSAVTTGGSASVRVGGKGIVRTGDVDTCGHPRSGGSSDVRVA